MSVNRSKVPHILAVALSVTGCEFIGPQLNKKLPIPESHAVQDQPAAQTNDYVPKTTQVELFPNGEPSITPQASSASVGEKASGKGEYSLNFDDADLGEVAKVILSDIMGKNYTISPQVTGKVTLQTSKPLTKEELLPTLDMLLAVNNAALVTQAGMYLIKPANEALYSTSIKSMGSSKMPAGYQSRIIPVRNVAAAEIAEILKPLLPENALLHVDSNRNILLVSGSGSELSRIMDVVNTFDVDVLKGRSFGLFTPAHVDASKIIDELDAIFNHKQDKEKAEAGSFFRFIEIERLNAILAITHQASYLNDIQNWILRLDRTNSEAGGGVNVYRAQHVSAGELADTLNNIFGNGSQRSSRSASIASGRKALSATNKSSSSSGSSSGTSSSLGGSQSSSQSGSGSGLDRTLSDRNQQNQTGSGTRNISSGSGTGAGGSAAEMPDVKIIADEGNNALIIVSSSEEYAKIQRVIKQLDVLPLQVLIDATIVEVKLTDGLKYGIQWFFSHENGGINEISGGANPQARPGTGINLGEIGKAVATGGFSYAFSSNSKDINAVLNASASNDNINMISSPSLMVLNNQEASIKVGDSVPIRTSQSTNTNTLANNNDGVVVTSGIQMVDTGINLSIRPRVNAGGLVLMDILQTSNQAVDGTTKSGSTIDSPTIQKREIESSVAVQSGETIVLGGLIREDNTYQRSGVPFLHEIPLIGPLFGGTNRNKDKNELVVLITPRVINSRQDAQSITEEFRRKLSSIYAEPPAPVAVEVIQQ